MTVRRCLLSLLGVVLLWGAVSRATSPTLVPGPVVVVREWTKHAKGIYAQLRITALTALKGFSAALLTTLILVTLFRLFASFKATIYPLVLLTQLIPKIAVLPLVMAFVSPSNAKTLIAAIICYFPMLESFELGIKEVPRPLRDYFLLLKASRMQTFRKLELPHAIPFLLSAAKVSFVFATIGAVTAELIYPVEGVGFVIMDAAAVQFNTPLVFCGIVTATFIGASGWIVIWLIERFTIRVFYNYKRLLSAVPS